MTGKLTTLQCSLINTVKPFEIENTNNLGYPLAPMTSAKFDSNSGNLKIRVTVFVDSAAGIDPSNLTFTPNEEINILTLILNYTFKEETPTSFSCFYVELDYTSDTVKNITEVFTQLQNLDPKTSRGTSVSIPPTT